MVKYFITIVLFLICFCVNAQTDTATNKMITFIEKPPLFSGNLNSFIQEHLNYPQKARQDSLVGTVIVTYWIDTLGITVEHKVIRRIRKDLDEEALRVTKLIKYKKPAMQRGKPIKVKYTVPIEFKLPKKEKQKQ